MTAGTTVRRLAWFAVTMAAFFVIGAPMALAQTETTSTPPLVGQSSTPYVAYVGTSLSAEALSAYLRPPPGAIEPAPANATVVSVAPSADASLPMGTVARGNVVTGWDFVGLAVMALGGVGGIGLLMGRRRSF